MNVEVNDVMNNSEENVIEVEGNVDHQNINFQEFV
jgi:hypothetical protein